MLVMVKGEKALYHCTLRLQIGRNSCPPHQSSFLHQIPKCLIKLNHIHSSPPGIDTHWHPPCISEEAAMNGFPSLLQLFPSLAIMSPTAIATYSPHPCAGIFFFFFRKSEPPLLRNNEGTYLSPCLLTICLQPAAEVPRTCSLSHHLNLSPYHLEMICLSI